MLMGILSGLYDLASDTPQSPNHIRVLVVDDNVDLAQLTTWLLRKCGFVVETVYSGPSGVAAARLFQPHFIVLDIGLPGLDGYQVAEMIRSDPELNHVVIIAMSAYGPDNQRSRSPSTYFNYHLTKPVAFDDLLPFLSLERSP